MKEPVSFARERSPLTGDMIYTVRISKNALFEALLRLDALERRMIEEPSESISDALIALETIVRKIEQLHKAAQAEGAGGANG